MLITVLILWAFIPWGVWWTVTEESKEKTFYLIMSFIGAILFSTFASQFDQEFRDLRSRVSKLERVNNTKTVEKP